MPSRSSSTFCSTRLRRCVFFLVHNPQNAACLFSLFIGRSSAHVTGKTKAAVPSLPLARGAVHPFLLCLATCIGISPLVSLTDRLSAQIDAQPKQGTSFSSRPRMSAFVFCCLMTVHQRLFLSMMKNLTLGFDIRDISKPLTIKHCQKQPALLCFSTTRCQPSLVSLIASAWHTPNGQNRVAGHGCIGSLAV
jgi:hypothetical protein